MKLAINCDGGARGNPGPAAIGIVIKNEKEEVLFSEGKCIGETTNNQAEYQAVVFAMEKAKELGGTELEFKLDSELVVKQLKGEYKVKNQDLAQQFLKIHNLQGHFKKIEYKHIYREDNTEADAMVNEALDEKRSGN
ncbi:ribonuclease HI family protein [Candidatus Kuenenbacteria bacterium]|nr:ribonuclease HI family protein [Candidatus Kuenenbacteria bacterium]